MRGWRNIPWNASVTGADGGTRRRATSKCEVEERERGRAVIRLSAAHNMRKGRRMDVGLTCAAIFLACAAAANFAFFVVARGHAWTLWALVNTCFRF